MKFIKQKSIVLALSFAVALTSISNVNLAIASEEKEKIKEMIKETKSQLQQAEEKRDKLKEVHDNFQSKFKQIKESISTLDQEKIQLGFEIKKLEDERDTLNTKNGKDLEKQIATIEKQEEAIVKTLASIAKDNIKTLDLLSEAELIESIPYYLKIIDEIKVPSTFKFTQRELLQIYSKEAEKLQIDNKRKVTKKLTLLAAKIKDTIRESVNISIVLEKNRVIQELEEPLIKAKQELSILQTNNQNQLNSNTEKLQGIEKNISLKNNEEMQLTIDNQQYIDLVQTIIPLIEKTLTSLSTASSLTTNLKSISCLQENESLLNPSSKKINSSEIFDQNPSLAKKSSILSKNILQKFTDKKTGEDTISIEQAVFEDSAQNKIKIVITSKKLPQNKITFSISEADFIKALSLDDSKKTKDKQANNNHMKEDRLDYTIEANYKSRFPSLLRGAKISISIKQKSKSDSNGSGSGSGNGNGNGNGNGTHNSTSSIQPTTIEPNLVLSIVRNVLHSATVTNGKYPAVKIKKLKKLN
ncbi:MAG: hypothetical protein HQK49_16220 [Oligoflexia bacterium]|nr:hypothetical protein [Oligoflexia bacterium]